MQAQAMMLSDEDIANLAAYYASLNTAYLQCQVVRE
ncbi:Cytochrome c553 [Vibrio cholerae]|nr:Cytochrome c553 [Vibrio cholerae]